jgi:hypothetical protein
MMRLLNTAFRTPSCKTSGKSHSRPTKQQNLLFLSIFLYLHCYKNVCGKQDTVIFCNICVNPPVFGYGAGAASHCGRGSTKMM